MSNDASIDLSTCEQRLEWLAALPEHDIIRGELLHAAAEVRGLRALLHYQDKQPVTSAMIEAGYAYMIEGRDGHKRWRPIDQHDLAALFMTMWNAR